METKIGTKKPFKFGKKGLAVVAVCFSLAVALIMSFLLYSRIQDTALANGSPVPLAPGQIGEFTVLYVNGGDSDVTNGVVNIGIGPKLEYVPNTLREQFGTGPVNCLSDSVVTGSSPSGTAIAYTPNTATTPSTSVPATNTCNGNAGSGPTNIPAAPNIDVGNPSSWPADKTGRVIFRARLKSNNTDPNGYIIGASIIDPAITAEAIFDNRSGGLSTAQVRVVQGVPTTIASQNLNNGTCTPNTVSISQTYNCTFPLTGDSNNYYALPNGGARASTSQNDTQPGNSAPDIMPVSGGYGPDCTITGNSTSSAVLNCSSIPTLGGTAGLRNVLLQLGSNNGNNSPGKKGEITLTDTPISQCSTSTTSGSCVLNLAVIGNGACTPPSQNLPAPYDCNFPINLPSGVTPVLPPGGITGSTSQNGNAPTDLTPVSGGNSPACGLLQSGSSYSLLCNEIPTTGGTPGNRNVLLSLNNSAPEDRGDIQLTSEPIKGGRVYFIGLNNAPAVWDPITEYNNAQLRTQKFKDGPMTLVYDNLLDGSGNPLTTGTCKFELVRVFRAYAPSNILKTYNSTIQNGKCTATFPVVDQTVNYYHVVVTATSGQIVQQNTNILVLNVGG
jgi:hypothetical protein